MLAHEQGCKNSSMTGTPQVAADIVQPGTVFVSVFNPPEGGTTFFSGGIGVTSTTSCSGKNSNAVSFAVKP